MTFDFLALAVAVSFALGPMMDIGNLEIEQILSEHFRFVQCEKRERNLKTSMEIVDDDGGVYRVEIQIDFHWY